MTENIENLILEHLRAIRADVLALREDVADLKRRMTSLEIAVSQIHGDFAGQSLRIDRLEGRLDRIDQRLGLSDA